MAFQPGANLYSTFGLTPENIQVPHIDVRAPGVNDILYPVGKHWLYVGVGEYVLLNLTASAGKTTANWSLLGSSGSGTLDTLTDGSGTTVTPVSNNIQIAGT